MSEPSPIAAPSDQVVGRSGRARLVQAVCLVLIALALIARLYLCTKAPVYSPDLLRHLGYASHAFFGSFDFYTTHARDFAPEAWSALWPQDPYIYPPVTLAFFHLFAAAGLGIFWAKLALTLIECVSATIIYRRISPLAALLFFASPSSMCWTSMEGEFDALPILFQILALSALTSRHWLRSGLWFGAALLSKHWSIVFVPYLAMELWREHRLHPAARSWLKVLAGLCLAGAPFLPYFWRTPAFLTLVFQRSGPTLNLFSWLPRRESFVGYDVIDFYWWSIASSLALVAVVAAMCRPSARGAWNESLPGAIFLILLKTIALAWEWYWMTLAAAIYPLRHRLILIHTLLGIFFIAGLIDLSFLAERHEDVERPWVRRLAESCLYHCDFRAEGVRKTSDRARSFACGCAEFKCDAPNTSSPAIFIPCDLRRTANAVDRQSAVAAVAADLQGSLDQECIGRLGIGAVGSCGLIVCE